MDSAQQRRDSITILVAIGVSAVCGLIFDVVFALNDIANVWLTISVSLLASLASLLVGALLGFLFGIPRALQHETPLTPTGTAGTTPASSTNNVTAPGYGANTNLEQISDWLTKILVGVGLTQLLTLPDHFRELSSYVAPAFGGSAIAERFGLGLILTFLVCGFMAGYLWTRLFLGAAFRWADLGALGAIQQQVEQLRGERNADALALGLTNRQLDTDAPPADAKVLMNAIAEASPAGRIDVYNQTRSARRSIGDCRQVERTIPIWEALIAADKDQEYFRNHAQLGYALLDECQPEYRRALDELTTAISMRDKAKEPGKKLYELNRARARIRLTPNDRDAIVADLRAAATDEGLVGKFPESEPFRSWMAENNITVADLQRQPAAPAQP